MARVRRRTRTRVDRNPYRPGVQRKPPKPRRVTTTTPGTPGQPGALSLNPDQQLEYGDRIAGFTNELGQLGEAADIAKANLPQELADIGRFFTGAKDQAASGASSRGIFQSSLRDIQLADINAQQVLQEKAAHDIVDAAQKAYANRRAGIEGTGGERQRLETWRGNAQVQNASENTTPGTPASTQTQIDRDPRKPGIQSKPPAPVHVTVNVGNRNAAQRQQQRRRPRSPHGDPFARR